jgi:SAM-dependent methyltransferase
MSNQRVRKLDFGCGSSKKDGFEGADILNLKGVEHVFDFNRFPYPFADNEFEEIWCDQVLEHLEHPLKVMGELYRISKPGCKITIGVPYFRSFYAVIDPTHRNLFGVHWFRYFDPDDDLCKRYKYTDARFKVSKLEFDREFEKRGFFYNAIRKFANKKPHVYEQMISHLMPLSSLTFCLKTVKNEKT